MSPRTRKRSRNTRDLDENARKAILVKRLASLCKKAEELSVLCDTKVGVVVFTPGETNAFAWPCLTQANDTLNNYLACSNYQRQQKLVIHEIDFQRKVDAGEIYISKIEQMAEEKEMENLFNQLAEGKSFYELDDREIKGLFKLFVAKRTKLDERKKQLNEHVDENVSKEIGANDSKAGEENDGHPWDVD